jgi:hypothetical protein
VPQPQAAPEPLSASPGSGEPAASLTTGLSLDAGPQAGSIPDWASGLPEGADLVRTLALALGAYWTLRGLWRSWRAIQRYDTLATSHGFSPGFVRRSVLTVLLRATLLDPWNLALGLLLAGLLAGSAPWR